MGPLRVLCYECGVRHARVLLGTRPKSYVVVVNPHVVVD